LSPSSTLAAITQAQLGATIKMIGTGRPKAHPRRSTLSSPDQIAEIASGQVRPRLAEPKGDDEKHERGARADFEDLLAQERHERALLSDQRADEPVDAYQERELGQVRPYAQTSGVGGGGVSRMHTSYIIQEST
jgi:hypothetical protein